MNKDSKIYVAGHKGLVGSAIWRALEKKTFTNLIGKTSHELDLTNQLECSSFFKNEKPEYVFLAAAKVGGIMANSTFPAEFIYKNLQIQNNVIHQAYQSGVKKLLFLGSSCIYPKNSKQPITEDALLTGSLEPTNEPYAIAKIAGIKMCESYFKQYGSNFISVMPTNLYGVNDNYDLKTSHVLPALIRKMYLARCLENNQWDLIRKDFEKNPLEDVKAGFSETKILEVLKKYGIRKTSSNEIVLTLWGSGEVFREFLHVDDMAEACIHVMQNVSANELYINLNQTHINIGTGKDISIKNLAGIIKSIVGFKGLINWDTTKPDGTYKKQLDVSLLKGLNWQYKIKLEEGIQQVFNDYIR